MSLFLPEAGMTGVFGTIAQCSPSGTAYLVLCWQNQSVPNSQYAGSLGVGNPLLLECSPPPSLPLGTQVTFDVIAAPNGVAATNVEAL